MGNNGTDNAIAVGLSGLQMTTDDVPPQQISISFPFTSVQSAKGQSTVADMIVYDSLGMPLSVRVTAILQERTSTYTAYPLVRGLRPERPPAGQCRHRRRHPGW